MLERPVERDAAINLDETFVWILIPLGRVADSKSLRIAKDVRKDQINQSPLGTRAIGSQILNNVLR